MPTSITITAPGNYEAPIAAAEVSVALHMKDTPDYYDKTDEWLDELSKKVEGVDVEINEGQKHTPKVSLVVTPDQVGETIGRIVEAVDRRNVEKVTVTYQPVEIESAQAVAAAQAALVGKFRAGQIGAAMGLGEYGIKSISDVKYDEVPPAQSQSFEGDNIDKAIKGEGIDEPKLVDVKASCTVEVFLMTDEEVQAMYPMSTAPAQDYTGQEYAEGYPAEEYPVEDAPAEEVAVDDTETATEEAPADEAATDTETADTEGDETEQSEEDAPVEDEPEEGSKKK